MAKLVTLPLAFVLGALIAIGMVSFLLQYGPVQLIPSGQNCARFVGENIPDGTVLPRGTTHEKIWTVQNCGTTTWNNYRIVRTTYQAGGRQISTRPLQVPNINPGVTGAVAVELTVPNEPGRYRVDFLLGAAEDRLFKDGLWLEIVVQ